MCFVAKDQEKTEKGSDISALAEAIASSIASVAPRRFVRHGEQTIKTPFNPKGIRNRKLKYKVFQNGIPENVKLLTDEEIALLAQLKPGRYVENLVTVLEGVDGDAETVFHINYKNKTADQRMALGSKLTGAGKTGLERLLRMMVDEHADNERKKRLARKAEIEEALASE